MNDPEPIVRMKDERQGSGNSRVLVAFAKLPDRRDMQPQQRHLLLDSDIRDGMARAARKLADTAMSYHNRGFEEDLSTITYDIAHIGEDGRPMREAVPTVVATLKITRPA